LIGTDAIQQFLVNAAGLGGIYVAARIAATLKHGKVRSQTPAAATA
jgi:hypothetical protein